MRWYDWEKSRWHFFSNNDIHDVSRYRCTPVFFVPASILRTGNIKYTVYPLTVLLQQGRGKKGAAGVKNICRVTCSPSRLIKAILYVVSTLNDNDLCRSIVLLTKTWCCFLLSSVSFRAGNRSRSHRSSPFAKESDRSCAVISLVIWSNHKNLCNYFVIFTRFLIS